MAPSREALEIATDAVVEYALKSLEPEFLRWSKDVNMMVAEVVWNAGGEHLDQGIFYAPGGGLTALAHRLGRARRKVPREIDDVMLFDLDVFHEGGEICFTFTLSWDEGESLQPCRIVVDESVQGDGSQN